MMLIGWLMIEVVKVWSFGKMWYCDMIWCDMVEVVKVTSVWKMWYYEMVWDDMIWDDMMLVGDWSCKFEVDFLKYMRWEDMRGYGMIWYDWSCKRLKF